jgi:hypothetical protein
MRYRPYYWEKRLLVFAAGALVLFGILALIATH